MKKYIITVHYEESGSVAIEANNAEEAEQKVYEAMENDGFEGLEKLGFDVNDRTYGNDETEEIENN